METVQEIKRKLKQERQKREMLEEMVLNLDEYCDKLEAKIKRLERKAAA